MQCNSTNTAATSTCIGENVLCKYGHCECADGYLPNIYNLSCYDKSREGKNFNNYAKTYIHVSVCLILCVCVYVCVCSLDDITHISVVVCTLFHVA